MLSNLKIQNIALIDEIEIPFYKGLNILTGETGSGKSILVNALCFALGARADKSLIRNGSEFAKVSAIFDDISSETKSLLNEFDIECENQIIISRKMSLEGNNIIKVNGANVTLSMLKEITATLVDVYGQFEHSNLLNVSSHIKILDDYIGKEIVDQLEKYNKQLSVLKELKAKKNSLGGDAEERAQKLDYITFQIKELEEADLKKGEYEELEQQQKTMANAEKIKSAYNLIIQNLDGDDGAFTKVYSSLRALTSINDYVNVEELLNRLDSVQIELSDISQTISGKNTSLEFDENNFQVIESRMEKLIHLQRKYNKTADELVDYLVKLKDQKEALLNSEEELKKIDEEIDAQTMKVENCAEKITEIRKTKSLEFENKIALNLKDLGMKNSQIVVNFEKSNNFLPNGNDIVEILFSANIGEPPKPLSKIISGGEMSRFCLAQKYVQNQNNNYLTMIFDEIDAGVSGQMGQEIAKKLAMISYKNQVICISHLPQIAAMADNHYKITKYSDGDKTISSISIINGEEEIREIARLAGGEDISQFSLSHAKDIKEWANTQKSKIYKGV